MATPRTTEPVPPRSAPRRHRRPAAVLLALVMLAVCLIAGGVLAYVTDSRTPRTVAPPARGAVAWPFQGTASVAAQEQKDATKSFRALTGGFTAEAQAGGHIAVHVGAPHALFAADYQPRFLDVVVVVAPVTGDGAVTGLAGLYGRDDRHHGMDAFMPLRDGDQQVSGTLNSYVGDDLDQVTVVIGGPRAGGLLVTVEGTPESVVGLPGSVTLATSSGVSWMFASVPITTERPTNGVLTVTDGNGDLENVLYYGRPSAVSTSG